MQGTQEQPSEYKTVPFFCLKTDDDQGVVDHIVTVFGIEDLGGDVSHPGSFTKTITERKDQIRVLDCHMRDSVMRVLGVPLDLREIGREELPKDLLVKYPDATGALRAKTQFLLDTPEGKGAFIRIKAGAVSEFSYAYDTLDEDYSTKEDGHEVRNLRTIRLWEYGPVIFGMNPATEVLGVKVAPVSIGGAGDEEKPAPDVTENTIRIRVKDPKGFQEGSFRTVNIGDKGNGISATMGRLKGETTMTIQSYIFDKKKWDVEKARKWVEAHKALVVVVEVKEVEPGGPDKCVCPKCGEKKDKERGVPCREMKCPKCGAGMVAETEDDPPKQQGSGVVDLITIAQAQIEIEFANAVKAGPAV